MPSDAKQAARGFLREFSKAQGWDEAFLHDAEDSLAALLEAREQQAYQRGRGDEAVDRQRLVVNPLAAKVAALREALEWCNGSCQRWALVDSEVHMHERECPRCRALAQTADAATALVERVRAEIAAEVLKMDDGYEWEKDMLQRIAAAIRSREPHA